MIRKQLMFLVFLSLGLFAVTANAIPSKKDLDRAPKNFGLQIVFNGVTTLQLNIK